MADLKIRPINQKSKPTTTKKQNMDAACNNHTFPNTRAWLLIEMEIAP
jgi:hypothetical protein